MPDQLEPIVQRMIDAGESEDNIATVIQHFKGQGPRMDVSAMEMGRRSLGPAGHEGDPTLLESVNTALTPSAHPQSLLDFAGLAIPAGAEMAIAGAKGYLRAGKIAAQEAPTLRAWPKAMLRTLWRGATDPADPATRALNEMPLAQQMDYLPSGGPNPERGASVPPTTGRLTTEAPRPTAPPEAPPSGLSAIDRRQLAGQNYKPETIAKIEAALAKQGGAARPPIQVDTATLPESWRSFAEPESPMQQPRVERGAERVGRDVGLTKEQVRQQTAPILGEAPGEASPILPKQTMEHIIDTLKALPKGSAEREAYVARATSGKTQWQVENIRRTLEHLGLIVPVAATVGREALLGQMRGSSPARPDGPR